MERSCRDSVAAFVEDAVFTAGAQHYSWEDVILAAMQWGDWINLQQTVIEGIACLRENGGRARDAAGGQRREDQETRQDRRVLQTPSSRGPDPGRNSGAAQRASPGLAPGPMRGGVAAGRAHGPRGGPLSARRCGRADAG